MCVPADAQIPDLDLPGPAPRGEQITLTSTDGTRFAAHSAAAASPSGTGFVVLPDVRGLFGFYRHVAEAFAASGHHAVAIDYFGRTVAMEDRGEGWDPMPYVAQVRADELRHDVAAAVEHLRRERDVERVMTVGFCMGGAVSLRQGLAGHGLSGVVSFYGTPGPWRQTFDSIVERAGDFECKVLGLYGGGDQSIAVETVESFDEALTAAAVEHSMHVYPGAPHSFFDRSYADWADECRDAWRRVMEFAAP